jgi:hypothetical protein
MSETTSTEVARTLPPELAQLTQARAALETCRDLAKVREIRDRARALEAYARAKKLGIEAQEFAQEVINRAERRMGQLLAETPKEKPGPKPELGTGPEPNSSPRQQAGKKLSARSQIFARIPEHLFERHAAKPAARLARIAREHAAEQRRAEPVDQASVRDGIRIEHCSLTDLDIEPGSADLIFTDPPYLREYLPLWSDLGAFAAKALKPGGLLITEAGQYHLPAEMAALAEHLDYVWCGAIFHRGPHSQIHAYRINVGWKPLLWYSSGRYRPWGGWSPDTITSGRMEKDLHPWQQTSQEISRIISRVTVPGNLVVDPFLGSGTVAAVCQELGLRFTGCDIDAAAVGIARERLA